ncbi:MAG: MFS transporter [Candidatus Thorarchaeota archaeon]|nr:MFS transporter [Candidatus Thorarchaeota archaeon]
MHRSGQSLPAPRSDTVLGLNSRLWRLAFVLGIAQFSASLWLWQFSIHLETIIVPWQMGVTFTAGTVAILVASPVSGFVSDRLGRKVTLISAFIPILLGLALLYALPLWPHVVIAFGLIRLGWGIIMIISRAIPADEISLSASTDSIRIFAMVLVPTYIFDGMGPLLGGYILTTGGVPTTLYLIAFFVALLAMIATMVFVSESLSSGAKDKAKTEGLRSFAKLGRPFWLLVAGTVGIAFFFRMTMPYFGNLCVGEWGIDEGVYAISWSAYSFTSALLSYTISGFADRNKTGAFLFAIAGNAVIMGLLAIGSGAWMLVLINILWAAPLVLWMSAESSLVIEGIPEHRHGSALGTYRVVMMIAGLVAANIGAYIWEVTGSLRTLYVFATVATVLCTLLLAVLLKVRANYLKTDSNA